MTEPNPSASRHDHPPATTTDSGIAVASDEYSLTVGPSGPTVLHDHYVVQKVQHFIRERVPERVVHDKGTGAHGFFEVTEDSSGRLVRVSRVPGSTGLWRGFAAGTDGEFSSLTQRR